MNQAIIAIIQLIMAICAIGILVDKQNRTVFVMMVIVSILAQVVIYTYGVDQ